MKVTFVYTDCGQYNQNNFNRGVAILSSCLKDAGYATGLIHVSRRMTKTTFLRLLRAQAPDLVAFSFISNMFAQIKEFSLWAEEAGIPAIHGGMHPTIAPEECLQQKGIKVVVRGEGEGAIVDLCKAISRGESIQQIPNVWTRQGDEIFRNPCRGLIDNLDTLPYPDYEMFDYEKLEEGTVHKIFVTQASRGCNYSCSYCCNSLLRSLYDNSVKFLRSYSVDRLLDEIKWGLKKYPFLKEVRFYDDTLTQNKIWFDEFAEKYKKKINLPYSGNERVENIDELVAAKLKESGCVSLDLGIESGNQLIREKYMNRRMANDKIIGAFRILNSQGINTNSFNILGMVGETPKTVIETIKLNSLVKPAITFNAYFYPFKGTQAAELVRKLGLSIRDDVSSFFERPVVKLDSIRESQLKFFYKYFFCLMKLYSFLLKKNFVRAEQLLDRILTGRVFPYWLFNFCHFGKDDMLVLLRQHPKIYLALRKIYRSVKSGQ